VAIRNGVPIRFTPKGICDAFDATGAFPGACENLSNLIFDQGNPEVVVSRPGVGAARTTFSSFTSPTFVSGFIVLGTVVYGMVSTARNPGQDEPFAYNILTNTFTTVTGVTAGNTPSSPSSSNTAPWVPPTFAVISTKIIVTHSGFNGTGANFFGVIDISNPAAPAWSSSNLATTPLTAVPTSVANYNNRAYYAVGSHLAFSDVLLPTTRTNASQELTVGDTTPITAQSGLPIQTTSAGIIGALVVFKGSSCWQVTGDPVTNNLGLNYISLTTGCSAPRSIVQGPFGIFFAAVDGPYILSYVGTLDALSHQPGSGMPADLQKPFQNATTPSRIAAGFTGNAYRVCVRTTLFGNTSLNDYWYDIRRKRWTGPHTFTYDCASPFGDAFILSGSDHGAALYLSEILPSTVSVYNDAGTALTSHLTSSSFPKTGQMQQVQVVESTVELSSAGIATSYNITALDGDYNTLNSTFVRTPAGGAQWGTGVWGSLSWSSASNIPHVYTIPWSIALVFQKMSIDITATSSSSLSIGTFFARYQNTGYTNKG
jgi:hypothetical protein